ncbi:TerB family tellurite resistance protein [Streptomyces sp. NPDC004959]|uniref:TerB family tellurite resistance protein n=1 Tax=unclassified Streptomyces TaxID=2593676 RepID=UPI000B2C8DC6
MARAGGRGEDRHQRSGTGPHRTPPARYGPLRLRTRWNVESDGEFFCPDCGGDRAYVRKTGNQYVAFLGVPLLPRGTTGPVVECGACAAEYGVEALEHPTTARFGALLRDAVHTVVVAVLAASGTASRSTMDAAVATVRGAGWTDCEDDQLYALMRALAEDPGSPVCPDDPAEAETAALTLAIELHESLDPLAPHLAALGRASILLQGARVALADGPYTSAEREALNVVGAALLLDTDEVGRLLEEAKTPS